MKIRFSCPGCDKALIVDEKFRGRRIKCPRCGLSVIAEGKLMEEGEPAAPRKRAAAVGAGGAPKKRFRDEGIADDEEQEEKEPSRKKKKKKRSSGGPSWFFQPTMAGWNVLGLVIILLYLLQPAIFFTLITKMHKAIPDLKIPVQPIASQLLSSLIMIGIGVGLICKLEGARKWFLILTSIALGLTILTNLGNKNTNMGLFIGEVAVTVVIIACGFFITGESANGLTVTITIIPFLVALGVATFIFFYLQGMEPMEVMRFVRGS